MSKLAPLHVLTLISIVTLNLSGCNLARSPVNNNIRHDITNNNISIHGMQNEVIWGLYDIYLDPVTQSAEIIPLRNALFETNITKFLQPPTASENLISISVGPDSNFLVGYAYLTIGIKHPYPNTNLRGFDVLGILMPEKGDIQSSYDPSLKWPSDDQARILNADGYTRWWNMSEFTSYNTLFGYCEGTYANHSFSSTSTLNPFKYFADGIASDDIFEIESILGTNRGSFSTSGSGKLSRDYMIQFPTKIGGGYNFRFKYAITSSYETPDPSSTPPAPTTDFPLSANRAEAVLIEMSNIESSVYYESDTEYGGDITFDLIIHDWQGIEDPLGGYGQVLAVYAESPTLFDGVISLLDSFAVTYEPNNPSFTVANINIADLEPDAADGQEILITVLSDHPENYSVQIPGGGGSDYPVNAKLAAYNLFEIQVDTEAPNQKPVADASLSNPKIGNAPLTVTFDPSLSTDIDGIIAIYEWDFDNDGIIDFMTLTPDQVLYEYQSVGNYEVQLKVTDDEGAIDTLDSPLEIIATSPGGIDCEKGPNLICTGDGNIFTDKYLDPDNPDDIQDNRQFFRNVINFDLGGPNSNNTVVKFYTGHGGTHNMSSITEHLEGLVISEGYTLIDTNEEPIDLTDCRIVFVCRPGNLSQTSPFTSEEYDLLSEFIMDGGRVVLTQDYSDDGSLYQIANNFLNGIGSSIVRSIFTDGGWFTGPPNECAAITEGVGNVFLPGYTSFEISGYAMSFVDDVDDSHIIVGQWY